MASAESVPELPCGDGRNRGRDALCRADILMQCRERKPAVAYSQPETVSSYGLEGRSLSKWLAQVAGRMDFGYFGLRLTVMGRRACYLGSIL